MKKSILLLTMTGFVLSFGLVFAHGGAAMATDADGSYYRGIMSVDEGPEPNCTDSRGSGGGGLRMEESNKQMYNGITVFDTQASGSGARGACAGGAGSEGPGKRKYNGITVF